jgi:hypothetical protein
MIPPRCIAIDPTGVRCAHRAAMSNGDLFCCTRHGLITLAIIDDWLAPATRRMLTYARWETAVEGRRLIDRMYRRAA